ncbi:MAG TPA: glycerate kinase [Atribacteraceae bacterium]|nr:glycerate kinase [Atribacteraceae bacterium]
MRVLLCPDSFKDCLYAWEVAAALEKGLRDIRPEWDIVAKPLADGGEGTAMCLFRGIGGELVRLTVTGPLGEPVEALLLLLAEGKTAVIELAQAAGLGLVPQKQRDPEKTTTYGVGELIGHALDRECRRILVAIGGSASNDAGMGALRALGARFFDVHGRELSGIGEELERLTRIDTRNLDARLRDREILVLSDVANPLYGPEGAAYVYAPQKGASPEAVVRLDRGLRRFAEVVRRMTGSAVDDLPGGGAAGGIGAGLAALCEAKLTPGIDMITRLLHLPEAVQTCDCVVSGEGLIDRQTFYGKAIQGVFELCRDLHKPLILVCGRLDADAEEKFVRAGVFLFPITPGPLMLDESLASTGYLLERTARRMSVFLSLL